MVLARLDVSKSGDPEAYWLEATRAEAALLLGNRAEAEAHYRKADALAQGRLADLSSTRRQARLLLERMHAPRNALDHCFRIPSIVVFRSGQRRWSQRTARQGGADCHSPMRKALSERLKADGASVGFTLLGDELDLIFSETMLERSGEIHLVVPFPPHALRKRFAGGTSGAKWSGRLNRVLRDADSVVYAGDETGADPRATFEYAAYLACGFARLKGQMLDTDVLCLSTIDRPQPMRRRDPPAPSSLVLKPLPAWDGKRLPFGKGWSSRSRSRRAPPVLRQHLKAILFADIVGYSKLPEGAIPRFVQHFLASIAQLVARTVHPPVFKNCWGDAFYFVFDRVQDAGCFALEMRQMIAAQDWMAKGLPKQLSVRTALHVGPIFRYFDPILRHPAFTGSHVSRTARIEPITEEGQIFASQEFAALAAAQEASEFVCLYAGQKVLPKGFGVFPIYLVLRRQEPAGPSGGAPG